MPNSLNNSLGGRAQPSALKVRGAEAPAAPVVPTAMETSNTCQRTLDSLNSSGTGKKPLTSFPIINSAANHNH